MRRRTVCAALGWPLSGCSRAWGLRPSYGILVDYDVVPGAATKDAVAAISDSGQMLFSPSTLRQRTALRRGGGVNAYGGATLPQWVRVTWRTGPWGMDFANGGWKGGTIVGDHRIEVAARIPRDVLEHASGRGRALRLLFRLHDDGVLLAWDVQDADGWTYTHHGGDFVEPVIHNGKLVTPGWYVAPDGRKVVVDR